MGFPDSSAGKESACNAGDLGSVPGLGRFPGEGKDYPLRYSGLENSMDYIVHGVAESPTGLSLFFLSYRFVVQRPAVSVGWPAFLSAGSGGGSFLAHPGVHSTCCGTVVPILCWLSAGAPHSQACHMAPCTSEPWRRQWQPTPVLLPGKSHGQRSLEGCSPWGR